MALFPILLVLCVEMGHFQSFSKTMTFVFGNIGVFIFDIFLVGFIFAALSLLVRHVWISAAICTVAFYTFSCIEYYKFNVSGSHFLISDLAMTKNVTDVATFANLSFNIPLFVIAMLLQLYVILLFFMNVKVTLTSPVRYAAAMGVLLVTVISLVTPYFNTVCEAAGVNYSYTKNTFQENERFSNNSLTANLAVSVNQLIHSKPKRPDDYNEAVVEAIVENELTTDTSDKRKVNVVTVMSESFADFRNFLTIYSDTESIPEGTYDVLDEIYRESYVGTCVVPTFGGGTVKTEIELIFGLPVEAQGNSAIPLSVFSKGREYPSVVSMYAENGYHTAYFHPFSPEFYERVDYYGNFGFDNLMFDEDMSVYVSDEILRIQQDEDITNEGYYHSFISDASVYSDVISAMKRTDGVDYIHITTMQNHMPYGDGSEEAGNYFAGIKNSSQALKEFINQLEALDEPVVLLYLGDHFPFFSDPGNIYNRHGIDADNCSTLYEQKYILWNNAGLEFEDNTLISSFYLPLIIADKLGVSDNFAQAVLSQKEICPVYSPVIASKGTEVLDLLTYDRISGNNFSD